MTIWHVICVFGGFFTGMFVMALCHMAGETGKSLD